MLKKARRFAFCAAMAGLVVASAAQAQDRSLTITRGARAPVASYTTFTDRAGSWDRVPAAALISVAPQYTGAVAPPMRRGLLVRNDVQFASLRNVSIRGLRRGSYYAFFGTPDGATVIVNPSTMRVSRVMSGRI